MKTILGKDGTFLTDKKEFHTKFGIIHTEKNGKTTSSLGNEFTVADTTFVDKWKKLKRGAQIPLPKDIGAIISHTGIGKDSIVLDAGAGSGGIALFLAHIVKHVTTYDRREDHCTIVNHNKDYLGIKNITVKHKDISDGVDETDVDLFTLDVPEPWNCIKALQAVKLGGWIASYSPQLIQVQQFISTLGEDYLVVKTIELLEREWKISSTQMKPFVHNPHSGFVTFVRKI